MLMLENRSFDHLLGYLKQRNPAIEGLTGSEHNYVDPGSPSAATKVTVREVTAGTMPYDPGHEFADVNAQLFGADDARPTSPARMNGFVACARKGTADLNAAKRIMECFKPEQLSVHVGHPPQPATRQPAK